MNLEERIAKEPAGEPYGRELATTKYIIAEAHAKTDGRIVCQAIKQLISLSKSRSDENRAAGRTVARDAMSTTRNLFCLCLQTVFHGYPDSAILPPLIANSDFDFDGEGISIFLETLFACQDRAAVEVEEHDFYVAADAHDREQYLDWLRLEPPSRFAEASALMHLEYEHWFKMGDRILVESASKAMTMLSRAGRALSEFERDFFTPADLDLKQAALVAWISQIPEQSGTAELWRSDVIRLCGNFADCVRFIILNRSTEKDRDLLLDKFVMPGASKCYPVLFAEGHR